MDYIFEDIFKEKGFKPETRKENNIISELKDEGFVFYKKDANAFFAREGVEKIETPEDITLKVAPKINYLALFIENDNFVPSLEKNIRNKHILVKFYKDETDAEIKKQLSQIKLGKRYAVKMTGFGKNADNEGYMVELPDDEDLQKVFFKPRKFAYFTTGLSKIGKEKDTANLDFVGVRPATVMFKLGISTTFGVFYSTEDFDKSGKSITFDKATLK